MSYHHNRRHRRARAVSVVYQPASAAERAFAVVTTVTMLLVSAYMVLM